MKSFGGGSGRKPNRSSGRGNQPERPASDQQPEPQRPARPQQPNQGGMRQPPQQQPPQQQPPQQGYPQPTRQNPMQQQAQYPQQNLQSGQYPQGQQNPQSGQYPQQQPANNMPQWAPSPQNRTAPPPQNAEPNQNEEYAEGEYIKTEPTKRMVALMIDFASAYFVGIIVAMIPLVNRFISVQLVLIVVLLSRDFLFGGRGVGKNFMGIRVVDATNGMAPTIIQSIKRNIILLAPIVVLSIVSPILKFSPFGWFNEAVMSLINIVGMIYVAIVLPLESWRVYSREDGLRIGDEFANTCIVESNMDFSNPIPR